MSTIIFTGHYLMVPPHFDFHERYHLFSCQSTVTAALVELRPFLIAYV